MNYAININTRVKKDPEDVSLRHLYEYEIDFDFDDDPLTTNQQNLPTGFAYKVMVTMLVTAIWEVSKGAALQGISEGAIIDEAIKQLEKKLIDTSLKMPKMARRRKLGMRPLRKK